jgi:hypothetical protein
MNDETAAWAVARMLAGLPAPEPMPEMKGAWADIYQAVSNPNGRGRMETFREAIGQYPNADEIERAILAVDPRKAPQGEPETKRFECEAPPLPLSSRVAAGLGDGAGRLLDDYVRYACQVSSLTPRIFHESAGLWLGSLLIARRLVLRLSHKDLYPNVMHLWVAPTTLYAKSTGLNVVRGVVRKVAKHLLLPSEMSPEEMVSELGGTQPAQLTMEALDDWQAGRNFAAQRGIVLDEASSLFVGMRKDYNIGLAEAFMRVYDCEEEYVRQTRGAGRTVIRKAYFTFLGATTPRALRRADTELLWFSGLWPRFVLVTADELPPWTMGSSQQVAEPAALLARLKALVDEYLPPSTFNEPATPLGMRLEDGLYDSFLAYFKATSRTLLEPPSPVPEELWGMYGRLAEQALKQAMILAAFDWEGAGTPNIEMRHWARGLQFAEKWRASAHRLMALFEHAATNELEDRIVDRLKAVEEGVSLRDLYRSLNKMRAEVETCLQGLEQDGVVRRVVDEPGKKGGRPSARFVLAAEPV